MALSESRLRIYLSQDMNTRTLLDLESQVFENILKIIGLYVGLINNLMLDEVLPKFLKSDLVHVYGSSSLVLLVVRLVVSLVIPLRSCRLLSPTLCYDLRCISLFLLIGTFT